MDTHKWDPKSHTEPYQVPETSSVIDHATPRPSDLDGTYETRLSMPTRLCATSAGSHTPRFMMACKASIRNTRTTAQAALSFTRLLAIAPAKRAGR